VRSGIRACLILSLAFFAATNAEAAELHGKVVENEFGGSPMAGIEIGAAGANPTVTGSLGLFHLELPSRKPGETVSLTIRKEGYEVVNDIQLEITLLLKPEDRPLTLLLCRPRLCEEMRRRFYRLKGMQAVEASYQRQLRELEQSKQATIAELAQLKEERDAALAAAERAAEELARTRPAEGSEMYQKAFRLFLDGQVNEALAVLDEAKLQSSLAAARARTAEAEREIEQVVQGYLLRGKLLALQFQFTSAEKAYQAAVEISPENLEACFSLAYFANYQKHYAQATSAYQRCLELAIKQGDETHVAAALNNLGVLLREQNRLDEARKAYDGALAAYQKLAAKTPDIYLPNVAATFNNLGILLRNQNCFDGAQKAYDEALGVYRQLAAKTPDIYLPDVAMTLNNLGVLLRAQNSPDEARKAYDEALGTYRQLATESPDVYLPNVAMTLVNLGDLLREQNRLDEAREACDEALAIYRQLVVKNPDVYLPDVATTLHNQGKLLHAQNRLDEARKAYDEALITHRQLAAKTPGVYLPEVAKTLNDLGILLRDQKHLGEARKVYDETLAIYRQLAAKNPDVYLPDVAMTLNNLGDLLGDQNHLHEALATYRQLAVKNPDVYLPNVAIILINLGDLLRAQNHLEESQKALIEASVIIEPFFVKNPAKFQYLTDAIKQLLQLISDSPERAPPMGRN
jgi:tetratricopeptide (TPR) repeat protein